MSKASTPAHVASPTAASQIPAADLEIPQTSTPELSDTDSAVAFAAPFVPYSRKEKRQQKKQKQLPTPSDTDNESHKPPNNPSKKSKSTILAAMPLAKNAVQTAYPLLVCSIGNPGSTYANTLHSAGHILTSYLSTCKSYKPFVKGLSGQFSSPDTSTKAFMGIISGFQRTEGAPVSVDEDWTFWQSTSLMNVSGRGVSRAYTEWMKDVRRKYGDAQIEGRLVVVHDELESALGKVSVREGSASAKGHNGLKSCQASLGKTKWWRVGVGIGRPDSREPDVVARYVLKKMNMNERKALENSAVGVFKALEEIAAGQR
jgi:PTH1 family peptidyl-tRNA hydrolase